jgi:cell division GTPase FtsZ
MNSLLTPLLIVTRPAIADPIDTNKPLKVFVLAGQSNMQGHGRITMNKDGDLAGFFWHQGWNDGCKKDLAEEYEKNMVNFIKDLGNENLPFVIATSGMGGPDATGAARFIGKSIEPAQVAAAAKFKKSTAVETRTFQKHKPSRQKSHWPNSAESNCLVGDASAKAMIKILEE